MAVGGIAIALLVLMAIQTMWPIAQEAYRVAHTNYQVELVPNIRYEQEYLAQAQLASEKHNLKLPNYATNGVGNISIEHDSLGYYLVYSCKANLSHKQALMFAKTCSQSFSFANLAFEDQAMIRIKENGPRTKIDTIKINEELNKEI